MLHRPIHKRELEHESETAKICFKFLDQTGRSFSSVVKELHPELLLPVCIFYLVLRGLDTIEDDTSIPIETKLPLLRGFKDFLEQDGWTFNGNRAEEKDRQLLVQFDNIIAEFRKMKPVYQAVVKDTADKMGNGMADFVQDAAFGDSGVDTVEDYDLYCWHVAGIVGEGLTRLFVEARLGESSLMQDTHLNKSMGLFLQKNNIIRDVCEDYNDGRRFWPKEIWSKHVDRFEELFEPQHIELALNCSSEMVLNALGHTRDCLSYLSRLREQSVFNFCAIPQSMATATLELCFRNPAVFERNVKITKGDAFQLMIESSKDIGKVCQVFRRCAHGIQQKNSANDPNYLKINAACEQIKEIAEAVALQNLKDSNGHNKEDVGKVAQLTTGRLSLGLVAAISLLVIFGAAWIQLNGLLNLV